MSHCERAGAPPLLLGLGVEASLSLDTPIDVVHCFLEHVVFTLESSEGGGAAVEQSRRHSTCCAEAGGANSK
jgi:hypothetical protein